MTSTVAMLGFLLAAVEISVSPDQPLGYSYIDDPLILEVRSDEPLVADVHVTLTPPANGGVIRQTFPETALGPAINRWCALKNLPPLRGPWGVAVSVGPEGNAVHQEATVYRIDRPAGAASLPLFAYGEALDRTHLLALRSVSIHQVRLPGAHPSTDSLLKELSALGMKAIVVFNSTADAAQLAPRLAASHCGNIARWELNATDCTTEELQSALGALQALPCSVSVSIGIRDASPILAMRQAGGAPGIEHIVVYGGEEGPSALDAIRTELAHPGDESPALEYLCSPDDPEAFLGIYFDALAHGATGIGFPANLVASGTGLEPGLACLNGLAHGGPLMDLAGHYPTSGETHALLFSTGEEWALALWSAGDPAEIKLPWEAGRAGQVLDRWNNPLDFTPPSEGDWNLTATPEVRIVRGSGGPVPMATFVAEVSAKAKALLARSELQEVWSEGTRETLEAVRSEPVSAQSRVHFFTLLRAFPSIEEHWHAGELSRPVAVEALAGLADLARTLCRLEAARGATFLEPLQDTLARCEEYQSRYLTGSSTTPQARVRGDWIVQEVRRLMDEVESLLAAGAKIEADAVAALAEWRARGLEFAAKAGPQSDQMKLPEPTPEPAPEATKKGKK